MRSRFLHSCIRVFDLEKSIDFYKKALGLEVASRKDFPDEKFSLVYLKDEKDDFELELTYNYDQQSPYDLGNGYGHLAVAVDNLEEARKVHEELGVTVTTVRQLPNSSFAFYFIEDPDGYRIEVMHK